MFTLPLEGPSAEVLTIGDELCRGEIVDESSTWLSERLTGLGLHVRWRSSTTDEAGDLEAALRLAATRSRVVLCSGGLGPTEDDRTVDAVARVLGVSAVSEETHRTRMEALLSGQGLEVTPNSLRQVRVPSGAEVLENRAGLAPGFHVRLGGADLFVLPGVPREMRRIVEEEVEPRLRRLLGSSAVAARRRWRVAAMAESHVDHRLRGLLDGVPGATLHFRLAFPENLVTVAVWRSSVEEAEAVLSRLDGEVRARLGDHVYGTGDQTLPELIGARLRERRETLATAESCTGGLAGDLLTDVPGASDYYVGGICSYNDEAKRMVLGVSEATLLSEGAVSEGCVREMADGARRLLGTTWAVAISGIAGPGGGSRDKPVGLVHFAVAGPPGTEARHLLWPSERRLVKQLSAFAALYLLHRQLSRPAGSAS